MFRGFRWQIIALLTAAVLFAISLSTRTTEPPAPPTAAPTQPPTATTAAQPPTTTPPPAVSDAAVPTPNPFPDGVITFREALIGQVGRLNPLFANLNPVDRDITSLIFEGLTRTNQYGEPEPALAASWIISSDGLEYIVSLREDVLWQDGIPFNADDVVYTMSILRSPDFPGDPDLGRFWRTVETEKLDTYLVRFRLTQPLGNFLDALRIGILPVHALEGIGAAQLASHPFNLSPIGTGAYQLEALRSGDGTTIDAVDLRVAPVYRQRPEGANGYAIARMRFVLFGTFEAAIGALETGAVDGLSARERGDRMPLLQAAASRPLSIYSAIQAELGALIFNWAGENTSYFRDQRVRVALQAGIDRASAVERRLTNLAIPADSPIMLGSWAYLPDLPWEAYNPDLARGLLSTAAERAASTDEAAATEEATAEAASTALFEFVVLTPDDPALIELAQEIANQWAQLGLSVSVSREDLETYQRRLDEGNFAVALVELSLGDSADPDVYAFWHEGQHPDGKNYGGVSDRAISEALERARQAASGINRIELYHQFQRDFADRAIAIPLYYPLYTYVTSDRVEGVQLGFIGSPENRFLNLADWTVQAG